MKENGRATCVRGLIGFGLNQILSDNSPPALQIKSGFRPLDPAEVIVAYPWYPKNWAEGGKNPPQDWASKYLPRVINKQSTNSADRLYSSSDPGLINKQFKLMDKAGFRSRSGVVLWSWWGPGSLTDQNYRVIKSQRPSIGPRYMAPYYEEGNPADNPPSVAKVKDDLQYILRNYVDGGYWRSPEGKPIIAVYSPKPDAAFAAKWAEATSDIGFEAVLKPFDNYRSWVDFDKIRSWMQYGSAVSRDIQLPYSITVSSGFWAYDEAVPKLRRDPSRFENDLNLSIDQKPNLLVVTTLNEWAEGSQIEPSELRPPNGRENFAPNAFIQASGRALARR